MTKQISHAYLEDLLHRTDIIEVVARHVKLQAKGQNHHGLCPFHAEKTPSFTVSASKQFYHCFGCGAHGNAIDFVMRYEKRHFIDSVESLAASIGLPPPEKSNDSQLLHQKIAPIQSILNRIDVFYHQQLWSSQQALDYLRQRGIGEEMIKRYHLGYAPPEWRNLEKCLYQHQRKQLLDSGIIIEKSADKYYDRLRDRMVFPIYHHQASNKAQTLGFGGRSLGQDTPKYLNSPETALFHKRYILYGLYQILKQQSRPNSLLVVEGYMDVISLAQHGIHNAVATLGTAISSSQIQLLLRYTQKIAFCFDADRAGLLAAWRALEASLSQIRDGVHIKFVFLPHGEDPDSYIRQNGKEAFKERCLNGSNLTDYFFTYKQQGINLHTLSGQAEYAKTCQESIHKLPHTVFRTLLENALAKRLNIQPSQLETTPRHPPTTSQHATPDSQKLFPDTPMSPLDHILHFFLLQLDCGRIELVRRIFA